MASFAKRFHTMAYLALLLAVATLFGACGSVDDSSEGTGNNLLKAGLDAASSTGGWGIRY